jgi:uncharacterized protein YjbI with pentapeptide repeats
VDVGLWIIGIVGAAIFVAAVVPGMLLWWPTRSSPEARGGFGVSLVTGAVVALAIFALQLLFEVRLDRVAQERQKQADRQNLAMSFGFQKNLAGIPLNGADLKDFFFYGKNLRDAEFINADLTGARLTKSDLSCARFSRANLTNVTAQGVNLQGTLLDHAKLGGAILSGAYQGERRCNVHTDLGGAYLVTASLDDVRLEETNFSDADLRDADLHSSHLGGSIFSNAVLNGAGFEDADLRGVDFTGADLTGAELKGAMYDSLTVWPKRFAPRRCPAHRTCRVR